MAGSVFDAIYERTSCTRKIISFCPDKNEGIRLMVVETLYYKDQAHQKSFDAFIEEMDLSLQEMQTPSKLLRRQFAFLHSYSLQYPRRRKNGFISCGCTKNYYDGAVI